MDNDGKLKFPVAIYGAGATANSLFVSLKQQYNVVCFCDGDKQKHGSMLLGLPVMKFDDAIMHYEQLRVYVGTNVNYKFEIMDRLITEGFPKERILNYEPYKKYRSCQCLETRIGFSEQAMLICPSSFGRNQSPVIPYSGNSNQNMKNYMRVRDSIIDTLSYSTQQTDDCIKHNCTNCPEVKDGFWAVKRRISDICFSIKHRCNFKCSYCVEAKLDKSALTGNEHLDEVLDTMGLMRDQGVIDKLAIVSVAPTEISIHPNRDKILKTMEPYICQFTTNCGVYVEAIAKSLQKGGKIYCSLDAGTPETFLRVKAVNCFRKVCDNLKKYAESGTVEIKYIFLPDCNDNEVDLDGFIEACKTISPAAIHIARNTYDYGTILSKHTMDMIVRMINKAMEQGLQVNCSSLIFLPEEYKYIKDEVSTTMKNEKI